MVGKFSNSYIEYKATYKKIRKLDVDAFREEGKDLSPKFT